MMAVKNNCEQHLKVIWILLSVAILLFSFDQCFHTIYACHHASDEMLAIMLLLSFPGSLLYLIFLALAFDSIAVYTPLPYFFLWAGAFIVGYVQWFWILPHLLQRPGMITLGLTQSGTATVSGKGGQHSIGARRRHQRAAWLGGQRVAHFDKMGRTPLERVIDEHHI